MEHLQELLPQHEIISLLGRGGMGAVFKGRQKSLDRMVAIKILPHGLDDEKAQFSERFKNEARTMARMSHPGIVGVYDFGEMAEGQFYFVMEYVDGTDVAQMISTNGKLPSDHALIITAHVCDALGYAHANGVIHRDIKPANILINKQGQVKVTDFGLARQSDASLTAGLTKTGTTMGTPDFIAPEALTLGADVDSRADLYAVGVMLYQMLTGEIPRGLFLMPGVKTKGEIDSRFDRIITRAMQTERAERYQLASEIRKDLDVIQTTPRVEKAKSESKKAKAELAEPKSRRGLFIGAAALIAVMVSALMLRSGMRQHPDRGGSGGESVGSLATSATDRSGTRQRSEADGSEGTSQGWTDGLAEWLAVPGNVASGNLKVEAGAWRNTGAASISLGRHLPGKSLSNVAVRVTMREMTIHGVVIHLRNDFSAKRRYGASLGKKFGITQVTLSADGKVEPLASFKAPAGYDPEARHTLEFRAEGELLTVLVDGKETGTIKDETLTTGSMEVIPMGGLIEKIEYRDLGERPL